MFNPKIKKITLIISIINGEILLNIIISPFLTLFLYIGGGAIYVPKIPPENKNVPNYINEFKIRTMIEKEYERLVEEEKGYPPGTFKIWEEDRVLILTNLF